MKQCYYCGRSDGRHDGACTPVAVESDEWTTVNSEHALLATLSIDDLKKAVDEVEAKFGKSHRSCDWGSTLGFSSVSWHTINRSISIDAEELRDRRMEDAANKIGKYWASRMNTYLIEVDMEWIG